MNAANSYANTFRAETGPLGMLKDGYADVRRACHEWLMRNDAEYARCFTVSQKSNWRVKK